MSVLCGWASIDENGKLSGGKAGDQTGKEVKTGKCYNFKQSEVLRWKNETYAKKYAKVIKSLCDNKHVGYDQRERTALFNELKRLNWDYTKLTKNVECDCSELVACGVNCVFAKEVVPSYMYTGNLSTLLMNTGYFNRLTTMKYTGGDEYLVIGDIINAPHKHVISALENGAKAGVKSNNTVAMYTLRKGDTNNEVKKLQKNLNKVMKTSLLEDSKFGTNTRSVLKKFQDKYGLVVDGVYGIKSYTKMKQLLG